MVGQRGKVYNPPMPTSIVFLDVDSEDLASVKKRFPDAEIYEGVLEGEQLVSACKSAEVISFFVHTKFSAETINQLPNLKLICARSVGYDHIDLEACKKKGITVCNVPDYGSHVIAEHVFALLLSAVRHVAEADDRVEAGEFNYDGLRGIALRGKTLGIIGTGKIGKKVAQIAHGFGMKIVAVDKCSNSELEDLLNVQYVEFSQLLSQSDIVTLHVPALDSTRHMINSESIAQMKDGVIIINTARGELIESFALAEGLKSGKVRYALLDVMEHEKNFEENKDLIDHPNAVTTPHIAFYAEESMRNMYEDCFESIEQYLAGEEPEHTVECK